jgi:ABC-type thiamin/hydroxymethylpyrimidine transport system permease subunit
MDLMIRIGGLCALALVAFHLSFWRLFCWREDLRSLTSLNRAVMQVMNLALIYVFLLFAYISFAHTEDLLSTPLGHSLLVLISGLWLFRAVLQVVFFKLRHPGSIAFLVFCLASLSLYAIPAFRSMGYL